ncbi:MAG: MarR family transcriptional regulator [Desulfotomaculum sp.]|nr:MarR family transcriptional regulator [Desulfotomaculum sp.]
MKQTDKTYKIKQLDHLLESISRLAHKYLSDSSLCSLSLAQMYLLKLLLEKGSSSPSLIAQEMGVTSGAITSLADRLHKQDIIKRERSCTDRRVVVISLTSKGRELAEALERERLEKMVHIFEQLPDRDIDELLNIYQKLDEILKRNIKSK